MYRNVLALSAVATLVFAVSAPAQAHPKLVASTPAANATVTTAKTIRLRFSERLMPKLSGAELTMTGMPGMASHSRMNMGSLASMIAKDGKTLILTPKSKLAAGTYELAWHAVSADTHRINGVLAFAVK